VCSFPMKKSLPPLSLLHTGSTHHTKWILKQKSGINLAKKSYRHIKIRCFQKCHKNARFRLFEMIWSYSISRTILNVNIWEIVCLCPNNSMMLMKNRFKQYLYYNFEFLDYNPYQKPLKMSVFSFKLIQNAFPTTIWHVQSTGEVRFCFW
jgi:hypothetical protein